MNYHRRKKIDYVVAQGSCVTNLFLRYFSDIINAVSEDVKIGLFTNDHCIWYTNRKTFLIKKNFLNGITANQKLCYIFYLLNS